MYTRHLYCMDITVFTDTLQILYSQCDPMVTIATLLMRIQPMQTFNFGYRKTRSDTLEQTLHRQLPGAVG